MCVVVEATPTHASPVMCGRKEYRVLVCCRRCKGSASASRQRRRAAAAALQQARMRLRWAEGGVVSRKYWRRLRGELIKNKRCTVEHILIAAFDMAEDFFVRYCGHQMLPSYQTSQLPLLPPLPPLQLLCYYATKSKTLMHYSGITSATKAATATSFLSSRFRLTAR